MCLFWFEEGNGVFSFFASRLQQLQEAGRAEPGGGGEEIVSSHLPLHWYTHVQRVMSRRLRFPYLGSVR